MTADFRAIRRRLGLSQAQAAAIVGISARAVQDWEAGKHPPGAGLMALRYYERLVCAGLEPLPKGRPARKTKPTQPDRRAHFKQ